jgi:hypothetical protein
MRTSLRVLASITLFSVRYDRGADHFGDGSKTCAVAVHSQHARLHASVSNVALNNILGLKRSPATFNFTCI